MFELIVQLFGQVLLEAIVESIKIARSESGATFPNWFVALVFVAIGAGVGALSATVYPKRFTQNDGLAVLSLVLNPVAVGWLAESYGRWRRRAGKPVSRLATFWGGASMAFAVALTRFLLLVVTPISDL